MIKKINILLVLLLLLVSIGAVSAADDLNDTIASSDEAVLEEISSDDVLTSNFHVVNKTSYSTYFDREGNFIDSNVNNGDTLEIADDFENKSFIFKKPINVVGMEDAKLKNCVFTFNGDASGSTVSNLKIFNTKEYTYGIFLNGVSNCIIHDCFINNTGISSYAICIANNANYNNVTNNNLNTYGITYGHGTRSTTPLLISGAHYNYIADNQISCDDANGIYLSSYSGGPLNGGNSNFNLIYNNTIKYNVLPTSWAYGVQLMGNNNIVRSNKIIGAYLGVSAGYDSVIEDNWISNVTGADFNHVGVESGGQSAIVAGSNSTIKNNKIINSKIISSGYAISASDNCTVENNYVEVLLSGVGIYVQGSNVTIKNNTIITNSGSGILSNLLIYNLKIIDNNITSNTGIGILIQKVSNKKVPGNITILYNTINTTNKYAIDAKEANKDMQWDCNYNTIVNKNIVSTPEGVFDLSKPVYKFIGNTYYITPENYEDYINDNGGLSSEIKDGDILSFSGEFNNKHIIYVNKAVKITGNNAVFYNTTFRLSANCVWIENLTIKNIEADRLNAWGVLVYRVTGATVTNCNIEVYDPNAAYTIYIVEASSVDIINNSLSSSGNYLTYTLLAHTVEDCRFINNTIFTNGTGQLYKFEDEHCLEGNSVCPDGNSVCPDGNSVCPDGNSVCPDGNSVCPDGNSVCPDGNSVAGSHVLREVYRTYGILIVYSSNNIVSGNNVTVRSKLNQTYSPYNSTNSIVGIDLYYNSHNNTFSNNYINVEANDNYIYGMGVLGYYTGHPAPKGQGANDNQFINNEIVLNGTYFVEGLVIGHESYNTIIKGNIVDLKSEGVSYGVNLEMSQSSTISNNSFTLNSQIIYGIEAIASNDNKIVGNDFDAEGKQAYGILFSNSNNNNVLANKIMAKGSDEEVNFHNFDSVSGGNAGIALKVNSTLNVIKDNNITSQKGCAINIDYLAIDNIISDNYLICENGVGNDAIDATNSHNTIEHNYVYLVQGIFSEINIKYLEEGTLLFTTQNSQLNGAIVKFYDFEGNEINSTVISDGKAQFKYPFGYEYLPGSYQICAEVIQYNYKVTKFTAPLFIDYGDLIVVVDNVRGAIARNTEFKTNIKDSLGNNVPNVLVEFYIVDDGYPVYIGKATSDNSGFAILNAEIPKIYGDNPQIKVSIAEKNPFSQVDSYANLSAYWLIDTTLTLNKNVCSGEDLAVLKDKNGNNLSNKKVSIVIDSKTISAKTDSNGAIKMPAIARGTYSITVLFEGDEDYYDSKVSNKINILPSIIKNKNYNVYYGNTVNYKVLIVGSDGKSVGAKKVVTIKVGSKSYDVRTDKNGHVTKSLKLKVGSYTITAEYNGDKVSNKITVKPTLTAKNIVKKKSKSIKFSAKLVNKNGKALKNKKITFKIKGKTYKAKTNKKGVATASIKNLKVGKFTITSSYGGCTIKNTIRIKK